MTDAQFGLRPGLSTRDAIFVLHSLISRTLRSKKRLYCCFVDFKKAFDSINHNYLWLKIQILGIKGKIFTVIRSIYQNVQACGEMSDLFEVLLGLMQGEALSPLLFSMFVNDLELAFMRAGCTSLDIDVISLFLQNKSGSVSKWRKVAKY